MKTKTKTQILLGNLEILRENRKKAADSANVESFLKINIAIGVAEEELNKIYAQRRFFKRKQKKKYEIRRAKKRLSKNKRFFNKETPIKNKSAYDIYIDSPEWQERKKRYYKKNPKNCSICGTLKKIHLHHLSYRDLHNTLDEELKPLCEKHHADFHNRYDTKKTMMAEFEEFRKSFK